MQFFQQIFNGLSITKTFKNYLSNIMFIVGWLIEKLVNRGGGDRKF